MPRSYRRYDPRLRNLVAKSGDISKFRTLDIPASTLRQWVKNGPRDFITLSELEHSYEDLASENIDLKTALAEEQVKNNLVITSVKILGFQDPV